MEISNNIKRQGGFIPGIRPGKPTTEYLTSILNYVILIIKNSLIASNIDWALAQLVRAPH